MPVKRRRAEALPTVRLGPSPRHTGDVPPTTVSLVPDEALLLMYSGDPFDFAVQLSIDGAPADVSQWTWRASIETGRGRLDFEWEPEPDGVRLWLRGEETGRLAIDTALPFDVTGRDPDAGEGRTVLRGHVKVTARVTEPFRVGAEPVPV